MSSIAPEIGKFSHVLLFGAVCFISACSHSDDLRAAKGDIINSHPPSAISNWCLTPRNFPKKTIQIPNDSRSLESHNLTLRFLIEADKADEYSASFDGVQDKLTLGFVGVDFRLEFLSRLSHSKRVLEGEGTELEFTFLVANPPEILSLRRPQSEKFKYEIRLGGDLTSYRDTGSFNDCPDVVFAEGFNLEVVSY